MCGIVGAVSARNVVPVLIDGIRRLEYRGYDSTGLAIIGTARRPQLERLVSTARVADLAAQADATHSRRTPASRTRAGRRTARRRRSTRIRTSRDGEIAVVHNGIIENYEALRERLTRAGLRLRTQTDTEVIAHLVHSHWHGAAAAT